MEAVRDPAKELFSEIRSRVYAAQVKKLKGLVGRHVVRDGVTFLVVSASKGKVVVSDTKTPLKQTTTFSARSFLSKAVEIMEV